MTIAVHDRSVYCTDAMSMVYVYVVGRTAHMDWMMGWYSSIPPSLFLHSEMALEPVLIFVDDHDMVLVGLILLV